MMYGQSRKTYVLVVLLERPPSTVNNLRRSLLVMPTLMVSIALRLWATHSEWPFVCLGVCVDEAVITVNITSEITEIRTSLFIGPTSLKLNCEKFTNRFPSLIAGQGNGLMVADFPFLVITNFHEPSVFWLTDRTMSSGPYSTTGWPPFAHGHVYR